MSEYRYRTLIETYVSRMKRYFLEKKDPKMTWLEAEDEIWRNKLKIQKEIADREAEQERFRMECRKCTGWSMACSDLMLKFVNDLPEEVFKDFYLQEGWTAYLPIEMGPLVKGTHWMYLMNSAVFDNPLIVKTFPMK